MMQASPTSRLMAFVLVFSTVIASVLAALALRAISRYGDIAFFAVALAVGIAFAANLYRVLVWSVIHKRFAITYSYPLTALFFPIIAVISHIYDEPVSLLSWVGVGVIVVGVALMSVEGPAVAAPREE